MDILDIVFVLSFGIVLGAGIEMGRIAIITLAKIIRNFKK